MRRAGRRLVKKPIPPECDSFSLHPEIPTYLLRIGAAARIEAPFDLSKKSI